MKSSVQRRITLAEMEPHVHNFAPGENKGDKILAWLSDWIKKSLEENKIKPYGFLPLKGDIAFHIGVSQSTMQYVYKQLEDIGYIESKQRIGSYIKGLDYSKHLKKQDSKIDVAVSALQKYIKHKFKIGDKLNSISEIALELNFSKTTIRYAIANLLTTKILQKRNNNYFINRLDFNTQNVEKLTLVEKTVNDIKKYVEKNFEIGDKIPNTEILSNKFYVSLKTVNDAIKLLNKSGFLYTRNGRYGTIYIANQEIDNKNELYNYEKIEYKLRNYIIKNSNIGDKLPTMKNFAQIFNTSECTVRKALGILKEDGYVMFSNGRYGGTFVTDIPQESKEAYRWLALNSEFVDNIEN